MTSPSRPASVRSIAASADAMRIEAIDREETPLTVPSVPTAALLAAPQGDLIVPALSLEFPLAFSLIIPTYNEANNIQRLVEILSSTLDQVLRHDYELIVVDDDSPDRTWEKALALAPHYPQLRVVRRQGERGLSTAVIRGWQVAQGRVLGVIDGDLQHPPEVLLGLWTQMIQGANLAVASRHVDGGGISEWSLFRRMTSRGAQILGLLILPHVLGRVSDPMSGYFLVQRSAIGDRALNPAGYKILLEVIGRGRIGQIAEVGYVFQERQDGESKVTGQQYWEYIQHLLRLRWAKRDRTALKKLNQRFPIGKFLRFGIVGFSGLAVDMAVFAVLFGLLGPSRAVLAAVLSAEVALINNFVWNDFWTFGEISRGQPGKRRWLKRLLKFNVVCGTGIVLQGSLMGLFSTVLGLNPFLAKLLAIAIVVMWNFWVNLKLNWRVTDVKK
ncbi:glycosyltransferase family 2 protein [Alkalinema sp. FACHB-956]|uniref:glycosyltransferase n=1 Tax=Alkalinema sp. FACHB-956 TaxID=2692768 RepID=UPI001F559273|nr:glycosyltransferase family 2 protein [Alkalinema sp. FACHB-956]